MKAIQGVLNLYKKEGETPLSRLKRFAKEHDKYKEIKMTYAGRLDPMARGVLLVLTGEEVHKKETYLTLEKEYAFSFVFGLETDTYDLLGQITNHESGYKDEEKVKGGLQKELEKFLGKRIQQYPPFSSKTVQGKPLFEWAREGRISEIQIPVREVSISSLQLEHVKKLEKVDFEKRVFEKIEKVEGDFRQEEIKKGWKKYFTETSRQYFLLYSCRIICGEGTYIRSIVHELGRNMGQGAVTFDIIREKVGSFEIKNSLR